MTYATINNVLCYQCSVTCGGGKRLREFWCQYDGKTVNNDKCPLPLPVITETCNDEPCAYWKEEHWSEVKVEQCRLINVIVLSA